MLFDGVKGFVTKGARQISYRQLMSRLINMTRRPRSYAIHFLSVLLCLCFSVGARSHVHQPSFEAGAPCPGNPEAGSTHSHSWKSIAARVQSPTRGVFRTKHSPPHSADLPSERVTGSAHNSSYFLLNNLVGVCSLTFLPPLQGRAPPHLA